MQFLFPRYKIINIVFCVKRKCVLVRLLCKSFFFFLSEGMNFSFGRRQEKVDWRRLGEKLSTVCCYILCSFFLQLITAGILSLIDKESTNNKKRSMV